MYVFLSCLSQLDLLDLMLLEDEDTGIKKTIRELCTTPRSRAAMEAEEAAQAEGSGEESCGGEPSDRHNTSRKVNEFRDPTD